MMARYNAWQNKGIRAVVEEMDHVELTQDRGAFFGSIFATLNHLMWGDKLWLHRFGVGPKPESGEPTGTTLNPTIAVWGAERFRTDAQILEWTKGLKAVDLVGVLKWRSAMGGGRDMSDPMALCVTHFFNHQTHHRGQVHAMLTAAGKTLPDTDLTLQPEA